jgi:hypothetical protein
MAGSLSSALDRLATVAQSCELTYRAGERHMRDRGTAAQVWACAEQTHELYRGLCQRLILMGAARGPSPTFPRFAAHVSDSRVVICLLTLEAGLRRSCAHVESEVVDDPGLMRELHAAVCASIHREAWLRTLVDED